MLPGQLAGKGPAASGACVWGAGKPPEWHGQHRHARGGCGHLLSSPAPLSACQGIKGLLAFVSGSPAPGSFASQSAAPTDSFCGALTRQPRAGGGAENLDPVSGAWVVAEWGNTCGVGYLGPCIRAQGKGKLVWVHVPPWRIGVCGSLHLLVPPPSPGGIHGAGAPSRVCAGRRQVGRQGLVCPPPPHCLWILMG